MVEVPADNSRAAEALVAKLRSFVLELDDDERSMLAALLAPGVALAYTEDDDVQAFGMTRWLPDRLPQALTEALRAHDVRITGL